MTDSSRQTALLLVLDDATNGEAGDEYVPGVCNIGPWEVRQRRLSGIVGLIAAGVLLAVLVAAGVPAIARGLVLLPAWGGAFSLLQARRRFCGAYALRGLSNFGSTLASRRDIRSDADHRADLGGLLRLTRDSFAIGLVVAVAAVLLPR